MLTRKDYVTIAEIISDLTDNGLFQTIVALDLAVCLADYMAADNPAFDRARFLEACQGRNWQDQRER
mgnify:CR=1 FL=1